MNKSQQKLINDNNNNTQYYIITCNCSLNPLFFTFNNGDTLIVMYKAWIENGIRKGPESSGEAKNAGQNAEKCHFPRRVFVDESLYIYTVRHTAR